MSFCKVAFTIWTQAGAFMHIDPLNRKTSPDACNKKSTERFPHHAEAAGFYLLLLRQHHSARSRRWLDRQRSGFSRAFTVQDTCA
jgi:hypothetical protein